MLAAIWSKGFLSFCPLPMNIKIKISRAIVLPGGVDKASEGPLPWEPLGQKPTNIKTLKYVPGSFGVDSIFLKEGSIMGDR